MSEAWTFADYSSTPPSNSPGSEDASLSIRTDLLSPTYENATLGRPPARFPRGPGERFIRERERIHSSASARDLLRLLVNEEYEARQNRKVLYTAFDRLESESRRAAEAENRLAETLQRFRTVNDARTVAQQETVRVQEELRLYQMQLQNAQEEITKAQQVLSTIEAQRDEAEAAAARARSAARQLKAEQALHHAREEGRRMGFEEGLRRGRNIGFEEGHATGVDDGRVEMKEIAETALDRMLEDQAAQAVEEHKQQELPMDHRQSRQSVATTSPHVVRVSSEAGASNRHSRNSSLRIQEDERDDTRHHRSRTNSVVSAAPVIPPMAIPPPGVTGHRSSTHTASPPHRPVSLQNSTSSLRQEDIVIPPDNYIPPAGRDSFFSLPPPHQFQARTPSPSPSQQPAPLPPASPVVIARDFAYESGYQRRPHSPESQSQASTKTTISQLDLVTFPNMATRERDHRRQPRDLSVIPEDTSAAQSPLQSGIAPSLRSERMSDYTFTSQPPAAGTRDHYSYRRDRDSDSNASTVRTQDRHSKQRLADAIRYSNPDLVEEWRRSGADRSSHSGRPPRTRPTNVTIPTPLSPQPPEQNLPSSAHRRTQSAVPLSQFHESRSSHRRFSSDESVPDITVQPPSGPSSAATSGRGRGGQAHGFLSPDLQPIPIPPPNPPSPQLVPTVPNTPRTPTRRLSSQLYGPPSTSTPVNYGAEYGRQNVAPRQASGAPPSRPKSSQSHHYAAAPVPSSVSYPAPPISRAGTPSNAPQAPPSPRSTVSTADAHRGNNMNAGMTPAAFGRNLSSGAAAPRVSRNTSNTSTNSGRYSRYDPSSYNDPAYFGSQESLVYPTTNGTNAAAAGSGRQPQTGPVSPSFAYLTVPGT